MPHTLLVANRGEISARIQRTAKRLGIRTVLIYTEADRLVSHLTEADVSAPVESYLDTSAIIKIARENKVTLLHPGYGFLSENTDFAKDVEGAGIIWLGPQPDVIYSMGLKHEARDAAVASNVPLVPGTGLLKDLQDALVQASKIGYPIMLKASAGGGGIGLNICKDESTLKDIFENTKQRCSTLFHNDALFLEKYVPRSRHIEVQVFGNGLGHVIHLGERECSVQRRHQKVLEETPSPFMLRHPDVRDELCQSAVDLCKALKYRSAGTIEFLVDDDTASFYFLEMNTRLQVEHPVTEQVHPGLDLVELMISQGIAQTKNSALSEQILDQSKYAHPAPNHHSIQARVYCENPSANFRPCPGFFQEVSWPKDGHIRIDTWIAKGSVVSPNFDPLIAKVISTGDSRSDAISRLQEALKTSSLKGPITNEAYLRAILESNEFVSGNAMTTFLDTFEYTPHAAEILSGGMSTTIQDFPGRLTGYGIPVSGPMDYLAFNAANILCGNDTGNTEALEITLTGPKIRFHASTTIAVTGAPAKFTVNKVETEMWRSISIKPGDVVHIGTASKQGLRLYLAVKGGFPEIAHYLGSKSTFNGLGGYQGRALASGDLLTLHDTCSEPQKPRSVTPPVYPSHWEVFCVSGPHDDETFLSKEGYKQVYETKWKVSTSSNRMGIRLEGPKIKWSRETGGEGGSHPSNVHDYAYSPGALNINGDTPVILTNDGPSMGGYATLLVILKADQWKAGQLRPGDTIIFRRLSWSDAKKLGPYYDKWLSGIREGTSSNGMLEFTPGEEPTSSSIIHKIAEDKNTERPQVLFRQSGDRHVLVEYGPLVLDLNNRARAHLLETKTMQKNIKGIERFYPCLRSTLVQFEPDIINREQVLETLIKVEGELPSSMIDVELPSRILKLPIVLDDKWSAEALEKYMRTIRSKAVYLPSNVEYLAKNNNLSGGKQEALKLLVASNWLLVGIGFYLACPFLVPIDPRCRLVGSKMNPSRTFTPEGAVGIAGLATAIYPVESPGGYSLFGRTLPAWSPSGTGKGFSEAKPWLFQQFDQVKFEPVSEDEYTKILANFKAGVHEFPTEETTFSLRKYNDFIESVKPEADAFKKGQAEGVAKEEAREAVLLKEWEEDTARQLKETQEREAAKGSKGGGQGGVQTHSNMSANVFKVLVKPGDRIEDPDMAVVILEAMKTEINVEAGDEANGKTVKSVVCQSGNSVGAGDTLITLE